MKKKFLTETHLKKFEAFLRREERSAATVEKYLRDTRRFFAFAETSPLDKKTVLAYKKLLLEEYAVTSANSMLASMNCFLRFSGFRSLCVKQFKIQREAYRPEEKELLREEYIRLIETAKKKRNDRLNLIIQTICGTGIRVSELQFITVDAVKKGKAVVNCKGKHRHVFIVSALRQKLLHFIKESRIPQGPVFVTRNKKPISRHNVWREMKSLCKEAGVSESKVFPHNLRHLFARAFYGIEKDIAKLADILGHANINTTRIYIATTTTEHRRKMEAMRLII